MRGEHLEFKTTLGYPSMTPDWAAMKPAAFSFSRFYLCRIFVVVVWFGILRQNLEM